MVPSTAMEKSSGGAPELASQKEIRYVLLGSTVTVWERVPSLPTGPGEACLLPEWGAMPETVPVTDVYVVVPP